MQVSEEGGKELDLPQRFAINNTYVNTAYLVIYYAKRHFYYDFNSQLRMTDDTKKQFGQLAAAAGRRLPLQVLSSAAGFYIGTMDEQGRPFSRESAQYWPERALAERALHGGGWLQKAQP